LTIRFCKLQDIQEKSTVNCDLIGCSQGLLALCVGASL
jgi:hypothetical protein